MTSARQREQAAAWRRRNPHYGRDWMRKKRENAAFRDWERERARNDKKLGGTGIKGRGMGGRPWRQIVGRFLGL